MEIGYFFKLWNRIKIWKTINLGPISLVYRFQRRVKITKSASKDYKNEPKGSNQLAIIVGVGPGFGYALASRLADEGFDLVLASRNGKRLDNLAGKLRDKGIRIICIGTNATDELSVRSLFDQVTKSMGVPSLVIYSLQEFPPGHALDITTSAFEMSWRSNCLGAFLVGREAGKVMVNNRSGSIIFVGSTSSIIGRAGHLNLAVGKFGQRALAQVLARELWPIGIHVAHIMIDADIKEHESKNVEFPQSDPEHLAQSIIAIHRQPKTAWSSEIDLRPWNESFWVHC